MERVTINTAFNNALQTFDALDNAFLNCDKEEIKKNGYFYSNLVDTSLKLMETLKILADLTMNYDRLKCRIDMCHPQLKKAAERVLE